MATTNHISTNDQPICFSFGDGIGQEVMFCALNMLRFSKAPVHVHTIEIGQRAFSHGFRYGVPGSCMDKIMEYKILLKGPMGPPQRQEFKELDLATYLQCPQTFVSNAPFGTLGIRNTAHMQAMTYIGKDHAIFEPNHPFMPELEDTNTANPTGAIMATCMMLYYLGLHEHADSIQHALLKTIEEEIYTMDMNNTNYVSTNEFTQQVCQRLGQLSTAPLFKPHYDYTEHNTKKV